MLIEASSSPEVMADLSRSLYLTDEVLRHKVIRVPEGVSGRARRPAAPPGDVAAEEAAPAS